jgi:peptidoglycan/LPS O-acetylase OafA/YrhL
MRALAVSPRAAATAARAAHARFVNLFVVSSSSGASLAYLDGIRGVAVLLVFLLHTWILSGSPSAAVTVPLVGVSFDFAPLFKTGYVGVDLFFVLSGFLLSQYWLKADWSGQPRPSTRRYFRHRFFRIVPAYYFCLFVMLLLLCPFLIPPVLVYSPTGAFILGAHLTFTQYLFPISAASYSVNGPLWTLTMEMIFYLVLPWAVVLFLRNRWLVTLPVLAALELGWLYLAKHSLSPLVHTLQGTVARYGVDDATIRYFLSKQFPAHFVDFALGITLANLVTRVQARRGMNRGLRLLVHPATGTALFFIGAAIVFVCMEKLSGRAAVGLYYFSEMPVACGFVLVLAGLVFGGTWLRTAFGVTPLRLIGLVGFSAYLWHMPVITLITKYPALASMETPQRFHYVVSHAAVIVVLLSSTCFLAIEKPFMRIGRGQRRASPVASDADTRRPVSDRIPVASVPTATASADG